MIDQTNLLAGVVLVLVVIELMVLLSILRHVRNIGMPQTMGMPTKPHKSFFGRSAQQPQANPQPQMTVVSKLPELPSIQQPQANPQPQQPQPEPEPETFTCKRCKKEFADKKKLQRHIGMAHYKDLEV